MYILSYRIFWSAKGQFKILHFDEIFPLCKTIQVISKKMFKQGQIVAKYKKWSDCPHQESNTWNASGLIAYHCPDHWAIEIRSERYWNFWLCLTSVVKLIFSLRCCIGQPETINLSNYANCPIFLFRWKVCSYVWMLEF